MQITNVGVTGLIVLAIIVVVGLLIKWRTKKQVDDLEGFCGIVDLDKIKEDEAMRDARK